MARVGARDRGDRSSLSRARARPGRDRSRGDDPALDAAAARAAASRSRRATRRGCSWSARSSAASCRPASAPTRRAPTASSREQPRRGSEALASVAVDRILGVLSIVVMSMVGVLAWAPAREDWRIAGAILALTIACSAVFWASDWLRWAIPDAHHDHSIARRVLRLSDAVGRYRGRSGVLAHVMAWSIVVQVLRITQAYFLGLGLGLTVPLQLLPAVHAAGPVDAAAADLDQRLRRCPRRAIRLAAPAGGRSGRSVVCPIDADCPDRPGRQPARPVVVVAAAPGNPVKSTLSHLRAVGPSLSTD